MLETSKLSEAQATRYPEAWLAEIMIDSRGINKNLETNYLGLVDE